MCIVCNCDGPSDTTGSDFLTTFDNSRRAMSATADAMLKCSQVAFTPEAQQRYDRTHKKMVKLIREWNKLEELRENAPVSKHG